MKLLTVLDEYTRERLALVVGRSLTSSHVVATLDRLISERGAPAFVRSDNGGEFVAHRVAGYLHASGSDARHIDPGAPWQNGYSESFNRKLRDELLSQELFACWPRPRCSPSDGAATTTSRGHTARSAAFHRPSAATLFP